MNLDISGENNLDPSFVRAEFDAILADEITSFMEIDSDFVKLSYNLSTISCIIISVERDREIKEYTEFPPERYTRQSYIKELVDIGLDHDDSLEAAVDAVIEQGYISVDNNGEIRSEISAFTTVGFLDTMFPGMPGMNLIAIVMQFNDEVTSGRKDLDVAKEHFHQTLTSRGVSVTKAKADEKATELATGKSSAPKGGYVAKELKEATRIRLKKLKLTSSARPSFHSNDGISADKSQVKSLFTKGPDKEELEAQKKAKEEAEEAARLAASREEELALREEQLKEAEEAARLAQEKAKELEAREKELEASEKAAMEAEKNAQILKEKEALMAAREAEFQAREAKFKQEEEERRIQEEQEREKEELRKKEEAEAQDIEAKIAAFEADLAMPCPLCHEGKVVSEQSAKDKEYYTCTNKACRFVSWDKPYHFSCPLCKNPFLTEFILPNGATGLKCPRAACGYQQEGLLDPAMNQAIQAEINTPKKKKKVVRRVKKRR